MHRFLSTIRKLSFYGAALYLSLGTVGMTSIAFADDAPCTTPTSTASGVNRPAGADAGTFTYQCTGPYAGLWTNAYYTYNPATGLRTALYSPDYSYDCATNKWSMTNWTYSPASGGFVQSRIAPTTTPSLPTGCAVAAAPATSTSPTTSGDPSSSSNPSGSTIAGTGPGSNNSADNTVTLNGTATNNTGVNMGNNIASNSSTGNTYVVGNTSGGGADSGNAQSIANIANLLQSTSNAFGPDTTLFTANINGDVSGDFMFDPSAILGTGPGSNNVASNNLQVNTNNTNNLNAGINNNIDVGATSGDATVADNTNAGNATSGNAAAVVNLMNLINSTVASGHSFIGTVNINGNLDGDILLPQGVLDQLLASTGPGSNNSANTNLTNNTTVNNNVNEAVANNIHSNATTGTASVTGNTSAGSALSGNSGTNVTLLNLTGSNTIGKNDLLVFVNVLGKWVGMIMNAPTGSTAAELGGGITDTGPNSNNTTEANATNNSNINNNANLAITNNVNVHANSGDATVTNNTLAGNAKTGNANTAVNVLNMMGSNLSLSDWFGVLFINVFGMWNGSFGVNTSAGDPASNPTNNPVQANTQQNLVKSFQHFANFVAGGGGGGSGSTAPQGDPGLPDAAVLGTETSAVKDVAAMNTTHNPTPDTKSHASFLMPAIGLGLAALILLASERDRLFGRKH